MTDEDFIALAAIAVAPIAYDRTKAMPFEYDIFAFECFKLAHALLNEREIDRERSDGGDK